MWGCRSRPVAGPSPHLRGSESPTEDRGGAVCRCARQGWHSRTALSRQRRATRHAAIDGTDPDALRGQQRSHARTGLDNAPQIGATDRSNGLPVRRAGVFAPGRAPSPCRRPCRARDGWSRGIVGHPARGGQADRAPVTPTMRWRSSIAMTTSRDVHAIRTTTGFYAGHPSEPAVG